MHTCVSCASRLSVNVKISIVCVVFLHLCVSEFEYLCVDFNVVLHILILFFILFVCVCVCACARVPARMLCVFGFRRAGSKAFRGALQEAGDGSVQVHHTASGCVSGWLK